jgi:hypothetical protein
MATIAYMNRYLWAKGELTEPKLTLLFSPPTTRSLTVTLALHDYNGVKVTDDYTTTVGAGTSSKTIELGDYLNAQQTAKGFGSGVYVLIVKVVETNEVFTLPLLVTLGYVSAPDIPDREYLQYYTVFDKVLGAYFNLPPTLDYIPSDPRFMVYAYLHRENKGRLIGLSEIGTVVFDTGYHQLALITVTLSFSSLRDMIMHMLGHSYGLTPTVAQRVLEAINAGDYDTALKLLRPFYMITFIGRVLTVEFDTANYEIRLQSEVYLGQWDWSRLFQWGAIGCAVGIIVAGIIAGVTGGAGAVTFPILLGGCIAGGLLGMVIGVRSSASSDQPNTIPDYNKDIEEAGKRAKETNNAYYNEAKGILDDWLSQGKITQDDYNKMMKVLTDWKTAMDSAIDDIVGLATARVTQAYNDGYRKGYDEGYKEGYNKGVSESKAWIIGAGVGGLLVGFALGRR